MTKLFALISEQGTACGEAVLCADHFTDEYKAQAATAARQTAATLHEAVPTTWDDVSLNEACACIVCGVRNCDACDEITARAIAAGLTAGEVASKLGIDSDRLNNGGVAEVLRLAHDEGDDVDDGWFDRASTIVRLCSLLD